MQVPRASCCRMLLFHLFIHVRFLDHLQDSLDRLKGLGLVAFFQKVVLFLYSWDIESNHLVICLALAQLICRSVNQKETFAIISKLSIQSDTFMLRGIHISQRYWYCSSYVRFFAQNIQKERPCPRRFRRNDRVCTLLQAMCWLRLAFARSTKKSR